MCRILIVYHSQSGHTEAMARRVAQGAARIRGAIVMLRHASEATLEELLCCDGLAVGSPEYFGYMAGMVKDFFDRTYESARGRKEIFKKPYVAFISAGNDGSGALQSIERICRGYPLKKVQEALIAKGELSEEMLQRCEELGMALAAGCEAGIF